MGDRWISAELHHFVEGELGIAVLNGLFVLGQAFIAEIIRTNPDRYKELVEQARQDALRLAVPQDIPVEARAEWRKTAVEAVDYFRDYRPDFNEPGGSEPEPAA